MHPDETDSTHHRGGGCRGAVRTIDPGEPDPIVGERQCRRVGLQRRAERKRRMRSAPRAVDPRLVAHVAQHVAPRAGRRARVHDVPEGTPGANRLDKSARTA